MAPPKKLLKEKYKDMFDLPADKLAYVNDLIFKQNKVKAVVVLLQDNYGIFKDYTANTLRQYLNGYKKEMKDTWHDFHLDQVVAVGSKLPAELLENAPKEIGDPKLVELLPFGKVKVLFNEAMQKYDAMTEMERLGMMQAARLIKALEYEAKLPTETEPDKDGKTKPLLNLSKDIRYEMDLLRGIYKDILVLQMDLGIRQRIEATQNHLHVTLEPHQQKLMKDFDQMHKLSEVTTRALELITGTKREQNEVSVNNPDEGE